MRKIFFLMLFAAICLSCLKASAQGTLVSGSLSTPLLFDSSSYGLPYASRIPLASAPGGLVATAAWYQYGMRLDWNVADNGDGTYTYQYYFGPGWYPASNGSGGGGGNNGDPYVTNKQIVGFALQLGAGMTLNDLTNLAWSVSNFSNVLKGSGTAANYKIGATTYNTSLLTVDNLLGETGYSIPVYTAGHEGDPSYIVDWTPNYTINQLFYGLQWTNPYTNKYLFSDDVNFTLSFKSSNPPGWGNLFANSSQTGANNNYSDVVAYDSTDTAYDPSMLSIPLNFSIKVATPGTPDTNPPTISISDPSVSITKGGPLSFTVTYNDDNFYSVSLTTSDVTLTTSDSANGTVTVSDTGANGSTVSGSSTRTVTVSGITGNGAIGISIKPGTALDKAGNSAPSADSANTFIVDNTPPAVTIGFPSTPASSKGPVNYPVTYDDPNFDLSTLSTANIHLNRTGSAAGAIVLSGSGSLWTVTLDNLTGDGNLSISIDAGTATDRAGNSAPAAGPSQTFLVDNTPPVTTASPGGGTYPSARSVTLTCNDGSGSGCDKIYYTTDGSDPATSSAVYSAPLTISSVTTLKFIAQDKAGNAEGIKSETYTIDTLPPNNAGISINNNAASANGTAVTLNLSATDNIGVTGYCVKESPAAPTSGDSCWTTVSASANYSGSVPFTLSSGDGAKTVYAWFRDQVGNVSATASGSIILDTAVPATTASPAGGTFNSTQQVTLTCTDNNGGSGCGATYVCTDAGCTAKSVYTGMPITVDHSQDLFFYSMDKAGNIESVHRANYVIDTTKPMTTATPAGGYFNTPQNVSLACSDTNGSGCASTLYCLGDGCTPSLVYNGTIAINSTATLRFNSINNVGTSETVQTLTYVIDNTPPVTVAAPANGTFNSARSVTLSCTDESGGSGCAGTYYCLGAGCSPTIAYSGPVLVSSSQTLRFYSQDKSGNAESVQTTTYIIDGAPPTTTATPGAGSYSAAQNVILSCSDANGCAGTYYCLGTGCTPSTPYTGAIAVNSSQTLRFYASDAAGNSETVQNAVYIIDNTPPSTTATPSGGWYNSSQSVVLNCVDNSGGSGCGQTYICADAGCTSKAVYNGPILIGSSQTIWFYSTDIAGNSEQIQTAAYTLDSIAPRVAITYSPAGPLGQGPYKSGTGVTISATFSEPMKISTVPMIALSGADSLPATQMNCDTDTHCTYNYTAGTGTGTVNIRITAGTDLAGNTVVAVPESGASFTIDNAAPTVVSTYPVNAEGNAAINGTITATFDETFDTSTVTGASFTLFTKGGTQVSGTVSYDSTDKTAIFTPAGSLDFNTQYTATIAAVKDPAGNPMTGAKTWDFTTTAAPDTTPPTIISHFPADGQKYVDVKSTASATFSETVDPQTLNSSTFHINGVNGKVVYVGSNHTAYFVPDNKLSNFEAYTVTVTTGVKDLAGNNMSADKIWTFSTAPLFGDLNGDGTSATVNDALIVLKIASGAITPTPLQAASGDVAPLVGGVPQPDGIIDIRDVVVILRKLVGLANW